MRRTKLSSINRPQRPILFSKAMVRAIMAGRKTQTRRLLLPQPIDAKIDDIPCRFGQPGDRLWIRERWAYRKQFANPLIRSGPIIYAADPDSDRFKGHAWRQSMYMPRTASRLTLEIISTHIERLKQITPADALAEGFDPHGEYADPIQWFRALWDSLATDNGSIWRSNPWVWVIAFKLLPKI